MPKPRRGAGFAQEAFSRVPAPCNASVDYFQRHGVTQDGIEGTVGDAHSAPAQFVKTAIVAPHNLVMIKTVLVGQVLHRRFGLHRPAQQANRATLIVFLGRVRDAAGRTAMWPLALDALKGCFRSHAMHPSSSPQRVFYTPTRPSACTRASQSPCSSASTSAGSNTVRSTSSRTNRVCRWRSR